MKKRFNILSLLAFLVFFVPLFVYAEDLAVVCQQLSENNNSCQEVSSAQCQAQLKTCADYYDQQSAAIAKDITKTSAQKNTLQNAITVLRKKISGLEAQIKQGTMMVKDLNSQIGDTEVSINKTNVKIEDSQKQIATILRTIYQEDQKPTFSILLEGSISDFFSNVFYLESLNARVSDLLASTKNLGQYLEKQKVKMDGEKTSLQKVIQIQTQQKQQQLATQQQQAATLKLTEAQYQKQQKDKAIADKNAASIKARIFDLLGVSKAPTFGEALEIAKYVSDTTGVRPAFLLAILTQESNLGRNVGQCYVTDFATGSGTNLSGAVIKQRVMNPKTIPTFVALTESLGMNPQKTPVSCWIPLHTSAGVAYGWGGAMGPAQFIASTWSAYTGKVTEVTGVTANPWNIKNAFLASGLLLKDNGALVSESKAAAMYYCGGNYGRAECKNYANSVLRFAKQYEADIKAIGG